MTEVELRKAIEVAPQFLQARYELGMLLLDAGNETEARNEFELIVNFSENSSWGIKAKKALKVLE